MNRIRICHLTSVHPRYDVRIFFKECKYLTDNYNVYLVVADRQGDEETDKIHIIDVGKSSSRLKRVLFTSGLIYRKAIDLNCSIYHFHDPELIFIGFVLIMLGKKVIYDVHEDVPQQIKSKNYYNILIRKSASVFLGRAENYYAPKFSAVITATEFISKRFEQLNHLTTAVRNFPILSEFKTDHINEHRENRICYIGGISVQRGINELIKIFDNQNDFSLELAGEIESKEIAEKINSISPVRIKYHGVINRKKIQELIGMSKIGLVILHPTPNHLNSLPTKMFEYMAGGIPVIASDFPLWKRIIEDNNCGICVNPFDLNAILKAIRFFIDNEIERARMGANGKIAVINKYQWEKEVIKLHDIYRILA